MVKREGGFIQRGSVELLSCQYLSKCCVCPCICLIKALAQSVLEYSGVVKTSDSSEAEQFTSNQQGLCQLLLACQHFIFFILLQSRQAPRLKEPHVCASPNMVFFYHDADSAFRSAILIWWSTFSVLRQLLQGFMLTFQKCLNYLLVIVYPVAQTATRSYAVALYTFVYV